MNPHPSPRPWQRSVAVVQAALLGLALVWAWVSGWAVWALGLIVLALPLGLWLSLAFEQALLRWVVAPQAGERMPGAWAQWQALWGEWVWALRIFGWEQPWATGRWDAAGWPAGDLRGRRGVVLVHGYVCNRGFWNPWRSALLQAGVPVVAVDLPEVFGDIDAQTRVVQQAVEALHQATGLAPVLVGHSMGGLVLRAWLRQQPDPAAAGHHLITIGSPHHGTWLARWGHSPNSRQMRQHSPWLRQLAADEASRPQPPTTCWLSACDNIVMPSETAALPGATVHRLDGLGHVQLAFAPAVLAGVLAIVAGSV